MEPSAEFLPYIYNYLYQLINNHPLDSQKEWARVCLRRLYQLSQNKFKKNFAPGSLEIRCTQIKKKIPIYIYFKNGSSTHLFIEPYTTVGDVFKGILRELEIDEKYWKYLGLFEAVEKQKTFNERLLDENLFVADIISSWDILRKLGADQVTQSRIYLGMKFYPVAEDDFNLFKKEIFFETLFNLYYGKFFVERYNILKLWGLAY